MINVENSKDSKKRYTKLLTSKMSKYVKHQSNRGNGCILALLGQPEERDSKYEEEEETCKQAKERKSQSD